jgi:hypothetical protein
MCTSIHTLGLAAVTGAASGFCVPAALAVPGRSRGLRSRIEEEEGSLLLPGAGEAALALQMIEDI